MSETLKRSPRLYVESRLSTGAAFAIDKPQAHYLVNVMRLRDGATVRAFNGEDGEWACEITQASKKSCTLNPSFQTRPQTALQDIHYLFAPLKHARLDYIVQKATELGCARIQPVQTAYTNASRTKLERMRANTIEALKNKR